jgi:hypothetical protein
MPPVGGQPLGQLLGWPRVGSLQRVEWYGIADPNDILLAPPQTPYDPYVRGV